MADKNKADMLFEELRAIIERDTLGMEIGEIGEALVELNARSAMDIYASFTDPAQGSENAVDFMVTLLKKIAERFNEYHDSETGRTNPHVN